MYISDELIDRFIKEDVPYIDLTTLALGINNQKGIIEFFTREDAILCGTEEVIKIFNKLNIELLNAQSSGTLIKNFRRYAFLYNDYKNSLKKHLRW